MASDVFSNSDTVLKFIIKEFLQWSKGSSQHSFLKWREPKGIKPNG